MEGKSSMNVDGGVELAKKRRIGTFESVVRILAFVLTLSAAVILGVNKQTKVVPVKVVDSLPPLNVPVSAKWNYLSAFLFFVVANAIACSYAAFSLILSLANRDGRSNVGLLVFVFDTVMMGLLFSANGAAAAVGLLGFKGNSHLQWNKVCSVFGKFCYQAASAIGISLLGATAFLLLIVLAAKRLQKK